MTKTPYDFRHFDGTGTSGSQSSEMHAAVDKADGEKQDAGPASEMPLEATERDQMATTLLQILPEARAIEGLPKPLVEHFCFNVGLFGVGLAKGALTSVEESFAAIIDYLVREVPSEHPEAATAAQASFFSLLHTAVQGAFSGPAYEKLKHHSPKGGKWGVDYDPNHVKSKINSIELLKMRLEGLASFYESLGDKSANGMLPEAKDGASLDPRRKAMVGIALGEVGRTAYGSASGGSRQMTDETKEGKAARAGFERVTEYFRGAGIGEDVLSDDQLARQVHNKSWCGIFTLWAAREAGFDGKDWDLGSGTSAGVLWQQTKTPQIGDVVNKAALNHHAIIVGIDDSKSKTNPIIYTVEGNFDGGKVTRKESRLSEWEYGAFSVDKAL